MLCDEVMKKMMHKNYPQSIWQRNVLAVAILLSATSASAATFTQNNWSGGVGAGAATQSGWTQYESADAGVGASTSLTISPTANKTIQSKTVPDFEEAANTRTHTSHADFSAGTLFNKIQVNNGLIALKPSGMSPNWTLRPGNDWDVPPPAIKPNAAFSDLDGDGDLDMMVVTNQVMYGYRNIGTDNAHNWQAEASWGIDGATLGWSNGDRTVVLGDVDGDGDADLFMAHYNDPVQAFENQSTADSNGPVWVARPGWNLAAGQLSTRRFTLGMADLDGTNVTKVAGSVKALEIVVGGENGVGQTQAMEVYRFDDDQLDGAKWVRVGTWDPPGIYTISGRAAIGDLNNNGSPDMTVGWANETNLQLITNNNTSYPSTPNNWTNNGLTGIATGTAGFDYPTLVDIDSDGDLDLFLGNSDAGPPARPIIGYENTGTSYPTSGTYISAVIDTGTKNGGYQTLTYTAIKPGAVGETGLQVDVRAGHTPTPDSSWTAWADGLNIQDQGSISFLGPRRYFQYRVGMSSAVASLTPKLMDLTVNFIAYPLLANTATYHDVIRLAHDPNTARTVTWNEGTPNHLRAFTSTTSQNDTGHNAIFPAIGNLNNDPKLDLMVGDSGGNMTTSPGFVNDGIGVNQWTWVDSWKVPFEGTNAAPALGDLDHDGDLDLLIGNWESNVLSAFRNDGAVNAYGEITATAPIWQAAPASWGITHTDGTAVRPNAALADLDLDGDLDMMVGQRSGTQNIIYAYENKRALDALPGVGPTWVRNPNWDVVIGASIFDRIAALNDIDGDGDFDLVVAGAINAELTRLFWNVGTPKKPKWQWNGGTALAEVPPSLTNPSHIRFMDFDDDGDDDAVIGYNGNLAVRYMTGVTKYRASGSFTSDVLDFGNAIYTTLNYTSVTRGGTLKVFVRGGNTPKPDLTWSNSNTWTEMVGAPPVSLAAFNGYRYLQYKVDMTAGTLNESTPELRDITFNYTTLPSPVSLISSRFDTAVAGNYVLSLAWNQTLVAGSDVRLQLRTSPDGSTWSGWAGPDGTSTTYWNSVNTYGGGCTGTTAVSCSNMANIFKDGAGDRWFQYKVTLVANGTTAPTLSSVNINYASTLPPGISLSKTSGLSTSEAPLSDSFTVVLDSQPAADVTITISSNKSAEATPSPSTLTFRPASAPMWNVPQLVTINGQDDFKDDGNQAFIISVDPSSLGDAAYNALATKTITGTNLDNDTAGVTISQGTGLTVAEAGPSSDIFSIVLTSEPSSNVTVSFASSDTTEATIATSSVTFTPTLGDWNTPRLLTVQGVNDNIDDGNILLNIITSVAVSADPQYNGMVVADVNVTNINDDTAAIILSPLSGNVTTEAGGTVTFTAVLGSEPLYPVTIPLSSSNPMEGNVTPLNLLFDSSNWNQPKTVTITGWDDNVVDGNIGYTVFVHNSSSSDPAYHGKTFSNIYLTNNDDEVASIIVKPATGLWTSENLDSATFQVVLGSNPTYPVTLSITSNDASEGLPTTSTLSFTGSDWWLPKTVTVNGVDDGSNDGDIPYTISVAPLSTGDPAYMALAPVPVSLTNSDNDDALVEGNAFVQTDWRVGTPSNSATCTGANGIWTGAECTAASPNNQGGWQAYSSRSFGVEIFNGGADLRSLITDKTLHLTSNGDFAIAESVKRFTSNSDFKAAGASYSNTQTNNGALAISPATISATWTAKSLWNYDVGFAAPSPALADLDGDGDLDMMVGDSDGDIEGFRNIGTDGMHEWQNEPGWKISRVLLNYPYSAMPTLADVDGDGDADLLVGFGDGAVDGIRGFENQGSKFAPVWVEIAAWKMTGNAIMRPTFANLNGAGPIDVLVGHSHTSGQIDTYTFDVTNLPATPWEPQLTWAPPDGLQSGPRVAVGDFNGAAGGDGDPDLLVGWYNTVNLKIITNTNTGLPSTPAWSAASDGPVMSNGLQFDLPTLADLDSDGDLDLLVGATGTQIITGFENTGTTYSTLGGNYTSPVIDAGTHDGFSKLRFTAIKPTGTDVTIDLRAATASDFSAGSTGWIIGVANNADLSALLGNRRYVQYRVNLTTTVPALTPLLTDLEISYVKYPWGDNVVAVQDSLTLKGSHSIAWTAEPAWNSDVSSGAPASDGNNGSPAPALGDLDGDGDLDMVRGDAWSIKLGVYRNDGNNNWVYVPAWDIPCCTGTNSTRPELVDMDADGDLDVMLAQPSSTIWAYENIGDATNPVWQTSPVIYDNRKIAWEIIKGGSNIGGMGLADLDNDGDLDALIGERVGWNSTVYGFENIGTSRFPAWKRKTSWDLLQAACGGCGWWGVAPSFGDLDGDGDFDLVLAPEGGDRKPYAYENVGTVYNPVWARRDAWAPVFTDTRAHYEFADLDSDGDLDLLHGTSAVQIQGYRNTGVHTYVADGKYVSDVIDIGPHLGFNSLDYTANQRTGTTLTVEVRAGNVVDTSDASWTGWTLVTTSTGFDISAFNTKRYVQYRVSMWANGARTLAPSFYDITFHYTGGVLEADLISSSYNTGNAASAITELSWVENLAVNTDVRLQLRTAADNGGKPGVWSPWTGPDGSEGSYWNSSGTHAGGCTGVGTITCTLLPANLRNGVANQWLQYKVILVTTGATQPVVSDVLVRYENTTAAATKVVLSTTTLNTTENPAVTPSATFTVALNAAPASPVTMYFSSGDLTEGTVSPSSLTFSAGDIGPKLVTVTSVNDTVRDLDVVYTVYTSATVSADLNYDNLSVADVTVTNIDDDLAAGGVIVSPVSGLTVSEAGNTATFSITLTSAPASPVSITVASSDETEGKATPSILNLTNLNWNNAVANTVTITGQDDVAFDQTISYSIVTSITSSLDPNYNGLNVPDVSVTTTDNEVVGVNLTPDLPAASFPNWQYTTSEKGGFSTFSLTLKSKPSADVTLYLRIDDASEASIFPFFGMPYIFTPTDWNVPQFVIVTGMDDTLVDGNVVFHVVVDRMESADANFHNPTGLGLQKFAFTNIDDDLVDMWRTAGLNLVTTEDGGEAFFEVFVGIRPTADVIIPMISSKPEEGYVESQLVIRPTDDMNRGKQVRVVGVDDGVVDGDQTYQISFGTAISQDPNFGGKTFAKMTPVTITNRSRNQHAVDLSHGGAFAGRATALADVNHDGFADLLVGAPGFDGAFTDTGRLMLFMGSARGIGSIPVWSVDGDVSGARLGQAVANAGDVNGDGIADIIVGAPGSGVGGRAYVYYGNASTYFNVTPAVLELGQVSGNFGFSVARAGLVNNDSYSDVIVGAPGADKALVYQGSVAGVITTAAQTLTGDQLGSQFGVLVSGGGDIDNNGFDDVLVGADLYDNGEADEGRLYAYMGASGGISATHAWYIESNQVNARMGRGAAIVGDMNGDNYDDVIAGAWAYDGGSTDEGRIYVLYGPISGPVASPALTIEKNLADHYLGFSIAVAGDVNRDGYADAIIGGANGYTAGGVNAGRAYVYYGSDTGIVTAEGLTFTSTDNTARMGVSVAGGADVDNDGYDDTAVGADLWDNGAFVDAGRAYVYLSPRQTAGVVLSPANTLLEVSESMGYSSFSVALTSAPSADVYIELIVGDVSEASLSTSHMLIFNPLNWNVPQTVIVAGVDDAIDDGDVYFDIITLIRSADANYNGINVPDVSFVNRNNDITVSATVSDASMGEHLVNIGQVTFTRTGPTTNALLVPYTYGGTATLGVDYTAPASPITIPAGQSSVTMNLVPVDDSIAESGETVLVNIDYSYNYISGSNASLTIVDNDAAGVTVSPLTGLKTNEAGGSASFDVVLNTQPSDTVNIAVSSLDATEGLPSTNLLSFTTANWNTPQRVTVVGQDDLLSDNNVDYVIQLTASSAGDSNYNGIGVSNVTLTNLDNENIANVYVMAPQATVSEASGTGSFVVTRSAPSSQPLLVKYAVSGTAASITDYSAIGSSVVIPANSASVTIPIHPVNDSLNEGDETISLNLLSDAAYIVAKPSGATVTINDDDSPTLPDVNFGPDQVIAEGSTVTVHVGLSRPALVYPVTINYGVSYVGATTADHSPISGVLQINSGTTGTITFTTTAADGPDDNEKIILTLGAITNAVAGGRNVHAVTISEANFAPEVEMMSSQLGVDTLKVVKANGNVVVTATATDPNGHSMNYVWNGGSLVDINDALVNTFVFDPTQVAAGFYKIRLTVDDGQIPLGETKIDLLLEVLSLAPSLSSSLDSDNDGIADNAESIIDTDNDGVPDYLDSNKLKAHELQQFYQTPDSYIMRTEVGMSLRLGDVAFAAGADGAEISLADIENYGNGSGGPENPNHVVDTTSNGGGYFDFEIHNLAYAGQTVAITIPQQAAIPQNASYRKYVTGAGWQAFVEDAFNTVSSAAGEPGNCPLPGDAAYTAGLTAGHYCIQLVIQDGGPNDHDGVANRVIEDPAQIGSSAVTSVTPPVSGGGDGGSNAPVSGGSDGGGSGGGSSDPLWLLLTMVALWRAWYGQQSRLKFRR